MGEAWCIYREDACQWSVTYAFYFNKQIITSEFKVFCDHSITHAYPVVVGRKKIAACDAHALINT